jgi:aldehyde:ferredoxin oxidoreductase
LLPEQDRLPKRLHREALPSGHILTEEEMERMLADYYRLRGWNEGGIPVG